MVFRSCCTVGLTILNPVIHIIYVAVITSLIPRLLPSFLYSLRQPGNEASNDLNNSCIYNASDCAIESVMSKLNVSISKCVLNTAIIYILLHEWEGGTEEYLIRGWQY